MRRLFSTAIIVMLIVFSCNQNKKEKEGTKSDSDTKSKNEVVDTHNAKNSLDYVGEYEGVIPCADCPGIKIHITLKNNEEYKLVYSYQDRDGVYTEEGKFSWDKSGSKITLEKSDSFNKYFVGENTLTMLDTKGDRITGEHANNYILRKK